AVGEGIAQPGVPGGRAHPVRVLRGQQERGQGEGGEPERCWVRGRRRHDRGRSLVSNGQLIPPCQEAPHGRRPAAPAHELNEGYVGRDRTAWFAWSWRGARPPPRGTRCVHSGPRKPSSISTDGSSEPNGRSALRVTLDTL